MLSVLRTQIQLTDEQARALRELAAAEGRSMADLIRESVEAILRRRRRPDRAELERRALEVVGRFDSGLPDIAERHDDYFAEAIEDWESS
ncbi:MAG: ribbon-helix-helix protein, CopG family [Thermoanaerobaculia bacterium]